MTQGDVSYLWAQTAQTLGHAEAELAEIVGAPAAAAVYRNAEAALEDLERGTRILDLRAEAMCLSSVEGGEGLYKRLLQEVRASAAPSRAVLEDKLHEAVEGLKAGHPLSRPLLLLPQLFRPEE